MNGKGKKTSIRVLLVDDSAILRKGVRLLLEKELDIEVVGEAEDGLKSLDLVRQLIPDIVITNIIIPNGIDTTRQMFPSIRVIRQIVQEFPNIKVIALTMHSNRYVKEMINAGVSGCILKGCLSKELVETIRTVGAGGFAFCPYVAQTAVRCSPKKPFDISNELIYILTNRERQVLHLICEGRTIKEIASELQRSLRTIGMDWVIILNKLYDNHDSLTPIKCISYSSE